LVTGGKSADVTSRMRSGKLQSLLELRDQEIPNMLEQLDQLASGITSSVNAIHNDGSGFPPPNSLSGTREVAANSIYQMNGKVMIGVTDPAGNPLANAYGDGLGVPPLTLNLSRLNSGYGYGKPTVQTIIDEINNYYTAPIRRVNLGNLSNIQLAAISDSAAT